VVPLEFLTDSEDPELDPNAGRFNSASDLIQYLRNQARILNVPVPNRFLESQRPYYEIRQGWQ
jgi:hypothetical protein